MSKTEHIKHLVVRQFNSKLRLGCNNDGGYVIADLSENTPQDTKLYDCYISAGVSNEESFSRDFINKYSMNEFNSFAFDGTVDGYPYHYTKDISFIKKNISHENTHNTTNLQNLFDNYNNIFLKMDIEGGEIPWLLNLSVDNLKKIRQLVIEFHGINGNGTNGYDWGSSYHDKIKCFEKLTSTHYLIHAHGNNNAAPSNGIPDVIELTYVRKDHFTSEPDLNRTRFPIEGIDHPNNPHIREIDLNHPPFCF